MNIVRLAAAGAGKTWRICNEAIQAAHSHPAQRILMVTYTNKGILSIKNEIEQQNFGIIPANIIILTWYQFLLKELIKPYQTYIADINEIKSFDFTLEHTRNFARLGTKARYITSGKNVRSEEASNLALLLNEKSGGLVFDRLEQCYSFIFVDEVQDMAGRDIDILRCIFQKNIRTVCVGDNKQATFRTHTTRTNRAATGENIFVFFAKLKSQGLVEIEKDLCSRRFNSNICHFANCVYSNDNNMTTSMTKITGHDGVFIIEKKDAQKYFDYYKPQELRYSIKTNCIFGNSPLNFGDCKGRTFERCLIHPPKPLIDFLKGKALPSPEKYYVALTRAKYSNVIVVDKLFSACSFENCDIIVCDDRIQALRYTGDVNE